MSHKEPAIGSVHKGPTPVFSVTSDDGTAPKVSVTDDGFLHIESKTYRITHLHGEAFKAPYRAEQIKALAQYAAALINASGKDLSQYKAATIRAPSSLNPSEAHIEFNSAKPLRELHTFKDLSQEVEIPGSTDKKTIKGIFDAIAEIPAPREQLRKETEGTLQKSVESILNEKKCTEKELAGNIAALVGKEYVETKNSALGIRKKIQEAINAINDLIGATRTKYESNPDEAGKYVAYLETLKAPLLTKQQELYNAHRKQFSGYIHSLGSTPTDKTEIFKLISEIRQFQENYPFTESKTVTDDDRNAAGDLDAALENLEKALVPYYSAEKVGLVPLPGTPATAPVKKTGIRRSGQTCYMISSLQMLRQTPGIYAKLNSKYGEDNPLKTFTRDIMQALEYKENQSLPKTVIEKYFELCQALGWRAKSIGEQNDAAEFLRWLLLKIDVKLEDSLPGREIPSIESILGDSLGPAELVKCCDLQKNENFQPDQFILNINRGKGDRKKDSRPVHFDEEIDIGGVKYRAQAAILHSGDTPNSGHYTTLVRDGDSWTLYNDSAVSENAVIDDGIFQNVRSILWRRVEQPSPDSTGTSFLKILNPFSWL